MASAGQPIDVVTVFDRLADKAEEAGGLAYLNSLAQCVPSARRTSAAMPKSCVSALCCASWLPRADEIATSAFNLQGKTVENWLTKRRCCWRSWPK